MSELLSYKNIISDIKNFKKSGTAYSETGGNFNMFDTPSHKYFKILFYFGSVPEFFATESGTGLLSPTWELFKTQNLKNEDVDKSKTDFYNYNSAWAYLKLNDEEERAEKLEQFVTLLSDISTNSPWYFSTISGIDAALERKSVDENKLDVSEQRKISITCLQDAYDNRIGTLLDLYRDITWSWVHKKEILPANLRKFDMAVYIFEAPVNDLHKDTDVIGTNNGYKVSYKMLEFHDCELNYNSVKSGWGEVNNEIGFSPKYTIDISYGDCYEISYNDIMMRTIGDVILTDLLNNAADSNYASKPQEDDITQKNEFEERIKFKTDTEALKTLESLDNNRVIYFGNLASRTGKADESIIEQAKYTLASDNNAISYFGNMGERIGNQTRDIIQTYKYEYTPGFLSNAVGQVAGHFVKDVKSLFTKAVLGNLNSYSLTKISDEISDLTQGNLIKTGQTVAQYIKNEKQRKENNNPQKPNGDIFPEYTPAKIVPRGNIFKNTIANNL